MPEVGPLVQFVGEAGAAGVLILVIVGLAKEWIVTGARFRALQASRDYWQNRATEQVKPQ